MVELDTCLSDGDVFASNIMRGFKLIGDGKALDEIKGWKLIGATIA